LRRLVFLVLAAALVSAASADAAFQPLHRGHGELGRSIVRAGTITVPSARSHGSVRVVVRLAQPPLARAFSRRGLASAGSAQLNARSTASRAYLRRLAAAQRSAAVSLMRAIPEAHVGRAYRVVLNGFAVRLPARRLPRLVGLPFVTQVYPSLRYTLATNESPALVGAPALAAATGARGDGMRIAIVDDGVDQGNRFFRAGGYSYPTGFPKGKRKWTTPKVIVARSFPGPGSGRRGRQALDRRVSFHGTHVAGIAAGNSGTAAPRHAPSSGTTASSPCRRRSASSPTRPRSSRPSRRPSATGWT
jgi:subtilisin family serine protease